MNTILNLMYRNPLFVFSFALFFWSCQQAQPETDAPLVIEPDGSVETQVDIGLPESAAFLSPSAHLARIAVTLTGSRPSMEALDDVHTHPEHVSTWVDRYLEDERFGRVIREMYSEVFSLRAFLMLFSPKDSLDGQTFSSLNESTQQAPVRLIEHVITQNRPFSEIVTADYTMADAKVAAVWGLAYDPERPEWQETRWPGDGRLHAGLLSEEYLFVRHYGTPINAQRGRANMFSRALLCHDYLEQDISLDGNVNLADPNVIKQAVRAPACAGCHESLDPFAANFWSYDFFQLPAAAEGYPFSFYRPEYLTYRPYFTDREPGYIGESTPTLPELGRAIANDPRFAQCTVKRFVSYFHQVPLGDVDSEVVNEFLSDFEGSDLDVKTLVRRIVLSDDFRRTNRRISPDQVLLMRPYAVSETVKSFSEFTWDFDFSFPIFQEQGATAHYGQVDLLTDTFTGFGVLAGGTDDFIVKTSNHSMTVMRSLVYKNLAGAVAGDLIARAQAQEHRALELVGSMEEPIRAEAIQSKVVGLIRRLYSKYVELGDPEVERLTRLFFDAFELNNDPYRAWGLVLNAMLQDPRFYLY